MPRIDFYIIEDKDANARLQLACRLVEKAYKNKHRIYIHTDDEAEAYQLDELLWTYREDSFLPHNLYGDGPDSAPPIQIGFNVTPEKQRDILVNLSKQVPEFYLQFNRVLEIVPNEADRQEIAREHYRFYKSQGHDLTTHKLQTVE
ncbi:MAG: DNA polymerase III subunit chi [Gammaproteobacteria bacterium]|nr:DNA polymerase III subunit chi [Gammaproteobacteria bacterium]